MREISVTVLIESWDGDDECEYDNVNAIRNALVNVAEVATEFYPGNISIASTNRKEPS